MELDQKLDTPTPHCPKCLSPDVLVEWHSPVSLEEATERFAMVPKWMVAGREPEATPERLALVCNRCQYSWFLLPADTEKPTATAPDPGPCPQCGGAEYRTNWITVDHGDGLNTLMPGSVTCLNPDCPPQGQLCSRWD